MGRQTACWGLHLAMVAVRRAQVPSAACDVPGDCSRASCAWPFLYGCICAILTVKRALFCKRHGIFLHESLYFRALNHIKGVKVHIWVCQQDFNGWSYHLYVCCPGTPLLSLCVRCFSVILGFNYFRMIGVLILSWLWPKVAYISTSVEKWNSRTQKICKIHIRKN